MDTEVRELRSGERFVVCEPLPGSFGSIGVMIRNIGDQGVQVEHTEPLRIATKARLWFRRGDVALSTQALVIWSHLSRAPNRDGKYLYVSGVRIEGDAQAFADTVTQLAQAGILRRDPDSMDRKRQLAVERHAARTNRPVVKYIQPDAFVPPEEVLLIQHARDRLRANPEEAVKWFNRARFAMTEDGSPIAAEMIGHREDVLGVWEYLERSVPLAHIVKVFEKT